MHGLETASKEMRASKTPQERDNWRASRNVEDALRIFGLHPGPRRCLRLIVERRDKGGSLNRGVRLSMLSSSCLPSSAVRTGVLRQRYQGFPTVSGRGPSAGGTLVPNHPADWVAGRSIRRRRAQPKKSSRAKRELKSGRSRMLPIRQELGAVLRLLPQHDQYLFHGPAGWPTEAGHCTERIRSRSDQATGTEVPLARRRAGLQGWPAS